MSDKTAAALDEALLAHVADEMNGALAIAWVLAAGTVGDPASDFYWTGPSDQPGYVSAGLGTFLHTLTSRLDDVGEQP